MDMQRIENIYKWRTVGQPVHVPLREVSVDDARPDILYHRTLSSGIDAFKSDKLPTISGDAAQPEVNVTPSRG